MVAPAKRKRLDCILRDLGLITEDQIRDALMRQKLYGGRFGSALLYLRFVSEEGLVRALSVQFGLPGVVLAEKQLDESLAKLIPRSIARAHRAAVFAWEPKSSTAKIAVSDPEEPGLRELLQRACGKKVELHVAPDICIEGALDRLYGAVAPHKLPLSGSTVSVVDGYRAAPTLRLAAGMRALIVTDVTRDADWLKAILESSGAGLCAVDSIDTAVEELKLKHYDIALIRESVTRDEASAEARLRAINLGVNIRWYSDVPSLVACGSREGAGEGNIRELETMLMLLAASNGERECSAVAVGRFASLVCARLGLPAGVAREIVTAALLSRISQLNDPATRSVDSPAVMQRSAELLASAGCSPRIIGMLATCHQELPLQRLAHELTLATLGASVLTVIDIFCDALVHQSADDETFETIKQRLSKLAGTKVLPEVADAFLSVAHEERLSAGLRQTRGEVAIHVGAHATYDPLLTSHLRGQGIRVMVTYSIEDLLDLCSRRTPDMILVCAPSFVIARDTLAELKNAGDWVSAIGALVVATDLNEDDALSLRQRGAGDVVADSRNYALIAERTLNLCAGKQHIVGGRMANDIGAHGRLREINLIDLIQALGPSRKTVRIDLRQDGEHIEIFLHEGALVRATAGNAELRGEAAVHEALRWRTGMFSVRNVERSSIPTHNISAANESILMEGCLLLDEGLRNSDL